MLDVVSPEAALSAGEPFARVVEPDAAARETALQSILAALEDGHSRVVRAGNPLRAKLTTERLLLQVSGAVAGALSEADMREAARLLLQRDGEERRIVLVIEQAETLASGALRSLEMLVSASQAQVGGPALQVVLVGSERPDEGGGALDAVEADTLPELGAPEPVPSASAILQRVAPEPGATAMRSEPGPGAVAPPVPMPPPPLVRARPAEPSAARTQEPQRTPVAAAAKATAPAPARFPPQPRPQTPAAPTPLEELRAELMQATLRGRSRQRFGRWAVAGFGLLLVAVAAASVLPWPAGGPTRPAIPGSHPSSIADRDTTGLRQPPKVPAPPAEQAGNAPQGAPSVPAAPPPSAATSALSAAPAAPPAEAEGPKPDLPAPADAEMARLRREFDQFVANSGRSTARLTPAQREKLFEEFLGWRARRPGPERGGRP